MLNKLKAWLLPLVKPLLLEHIDKLHLLDPKVSAMIQEKTHASKEESDALALSLMNVVIVELEVLINKI